MSLRDIAQPFRTGGNDNGYRSMTSIDIQLLTRSNARLPAVSLHRRNPTGTKVVDLTKPAVESTHTRHNYRYIVPEPVLLLPNTTYWVVVGGSSGIAQ